MNATVGTSGILVILVGMALASFPVITTVPNASYSACMASLPASFCQSEYNQFLFTAEFQYRPAGEIVAIAGLVTFVAGALSKEEAFPGGGARRIHWALILIGGIAVLVDALVVLQIAGNATGMNASLHYVITSSDPYYQIVFPAFGLVLVGLILSIAGSIRLVEGLLARERS